MLDNCLVSVRLACGKNLPLETRNEDERSYINTVEIEFPLAVWKNST